MAEQLNYQINVSGNAGESVGSLKKQLREASAEVAILSDKFGATSKEAIEAAKRAAELKDRIGDARALTEAFNPDAKFKALSASLSGVAGGFAAVQGAIGLFGGESKELEKQLLKVQSALALSQGLQSIGESIDSFKQLGAVIQSTTLFTKANQAANVATAATMRALGVAAETTSLSFKALKAAIVSTGILAAVVVIGEIISALIDWADTTDETTEANKKLNDELERQNEILDANASDISRRNKIEIARLKAQGADEATIRKKLLNNAYTDYQTAFEAQKKASNLYNKALGNADAETLKKLTENLSNREKATKDAYATYLELGYNQNAEEDKQREENEKKQKEKRDKKIADDLEQEKQKNDKLLQLQKEQAEKESAAQKVQIDAFRATLTQREQDILKAEDELEQKRSVLIQAGNFEFQRIEEENRIKVAEINAKYDQEELDKQKELDDKKRDAAEKEVERKKEYEERKRNFEIESQQLTEELQARREQLLLNGLSVLGAIAGENEKIANTIFAIQKGLEIAKVVSSASASIGQIISSTQAIPPILPPGVPNPAYISAVALGAKRAAIVKVGAAAQIAGIAATSISRFKNGGAGAIGGGVSGEAANPPLSPQSTATNLSASTINAIGNSAIRAYVVETDITSNQKRIQAIKQKARFS